MATATVPNIFANQAGPIPLAQLDANFAAVLVGAATGGYQVATTYTAGQVGYKLQESVSVKDFGAVGDGVTNDIVAIQAAHDYLAALSNGGFLLFPPGGIYKANAGFTWNPNKVGILGNGAAIDFSALTAGIYAFTLNQTTTDVNVRHGQNRSHPCTALYLNGPGGTVAATALKLIDPTGSNSMSGITFRSCAFLNFYRDIEFGVGSFLNVFDSCDFFNTSGSGFDTIIYNPATTNSGENNQFLACNFNKGTGSVIRQLNGNATTFFSGCSADYMTNVFDVQAGECDWSEGYIESNTDTNYWCKVSGQNSLLRISGRITITGTKTAFEVFYSDPTATNGGLYLDLSIQFSPITYNLDLIAVAGTGRARAIIRAHSNTTTHPALGGGTNVLGNGGFEATQLTDFTLGGTTVPTRSNTVAHTGTWSLRFQGLAGQNNNALRSIPCSPGQQLVGSLWWQAPAITGTGTTFLIQVDYFDAGGTSLQTSALLSANTNQTTWAKLLLGQQLPAPIGTATARLLVAIFGTSSGTPLAYIDDVTLAVA